MLAYRSAGIALVLVSVGGGAVYGQIPGAAGSGDGAGLRFGGLAPAEDARRAAQGGHAATVDAPVVGVGVGSGWGSGARGANSVKMSAIRMGVDG